MTEVYGFIAEFNPFHNGHKLFIDQIKQKYHPDVLIAVMSGNFVQRGDFAIMDKWERAQVAIENGVDLVIELPLAFAVEPAHLFAQGSIELLHQLNVDAIVFGTEMQIDFIDIAQKMLMTNQIFEQDYQLSSADNLSNYYRSLGIDVTRLPNQLLGLNYVLEIVKHGYDIKIKTIQRNADDFSATKIRKNYVERQSLMGLVPDLSNHFLSNQESISWNDYYPFLKYKIINQSAEELHGIYQMVEGLEYKFKKEIMTSTNFEQFVEQVKSKRYTMARIRRLLLYTLLNIKESEINNVYDNPYLRILGFNKSGQKYLNNLKNDDLNLITRVGKKERSNLDLEIRADRIRQLVTNNEQDFGRIPYMKGVN